MGIIAKLYADGQIYNVLQAEQSIIQRSDETGRPTSRPFHTGLIAVIESTKDTYFFEKAIHPTQQIQEIILEYTNSMLGSRTRRIRFIDCHVTFDRTDFKANGRESLTETLIITAAGIEDSHSRGKYTTPRRVTEFLSDQVPVTINETEKKLIQFYITDLEGNELDKYESSDKIVLNIETENAIGEYLTIRIPDKTYDFKHNGIVLENDTLKDYKISSDLEKLELEVIEQG